MKRFALFTMALLLSISFSACASSGNKAPMDPVNPNCIMMPDHPSDPDVSVMYKGVKVGFCCEDCIEKWNNLSDAQKDAKLNQLKK